MGGSISHDRELASLPVHREDPGRAVGVRLELPPEPEDVGVTVPDDARLVHEERGGPARTPQRFQTAKSLSCTTG